MFRKIVEKINFDPLVFLMISTIGVIAAYFSQRNGLAMVYNDAMSHINISRLVWDNQQPGFAQIGSIWLPLNHLLSVFLVWNDWLWKTGLAGSIYSFISFILSGFFLYKSIYIITKNRLAGFAGLLVFATNLNMLYLQTTPLTEPLFLLFFVSSFYTFLVYLGSKNGSSKYLTVLGLLGLLSVLTRYDGWFLVLVEFVLILFNEVTIKKNQAKVIGKLTLFALPVVFGMAVWIMWNYFILGDPLYFVFGPDSAFEQQLLIKEQGDLVTQKDLGASFMTYARSVFYILGFPILLLTAFGLVILLLKNQIPLYKKLLILAVLISPLIFNVITLYLGFTHMVVAKVSPLDHLSTSNDWFNVRYGIFALPFTAVLIGIYSSMRNAFPFVFIVMILQFFIFYYQGTVILTDGLSGASSFKDYYGISLQLRNQVKNEETILMSFSHFNPVAFRSNIKLKHFVHEGIKFEWENALLSPQDHVDWIVTGGDAKTTDTVYQALLLNEEAQFLDHYYLVYEDTYSRLYKLKTEPDELLTTKEVEVR
jgi:hypothetical protein